MIHGLLSSESKFHQIYDTTSDAIILMSELKIIDGNKAALTLFGCYNKDELCACHPADLSPLKQDNGEDSIPLLLQHLDKTKKEGNARFEWTCQRHDNGLIFTTDVTLNSIILNNKSFTQANLRDISESKRIDKMKSEFVSTVSHELRTPVTSITGALGLINGGA